MTHLTTRMLEEDAQKLSDLATMNFELIKDKCSTRNETQDYYLGLLMRQSIILKDISSILKDRNILFISTPYILLRSLMDDFLHALYLELHENRDEEIIKISAVVRAHSFNAISKLTDSNYKHFKGKYPFYLTEEEVRQLKDTVIQNPENAKYFEDISKFKFKKFRTLSELVKNIHGSRDMEIFKDRAFFSWTEFSDFIHYSTFSLFYEQTPEYKTQNQQKIDEAFQFCYNTIYLSFKYFERRDKVPFIDNPELNEKYGIIHRC
jgi:hypothetical protein